MINEENSILGINRRLYEWSKKTEIFQELMYDEQIIKKLLGGDASERGLASREYAKEIWRRYPELGPEPLFDILSKEEYNRSFYENYRDHTTHQVKVMLLGACIYEKCDLVRNAVNDYIKKEFLCKKDEEIILIFIRIWVATSLFHDIGYLFESEQVEESHDTFWEKIKNAINECLKFPLSNTRGLEISKRTEKSVKVASDEMEGYQSLESEELFNFLKDFGEKSCLAESEKNALIAYYDYAQKTDPIKGREKFRDHGIASALLLLKIWQSYRRHLAEINKYETKNVKTKKALQRVRAIYEKIDMYEYEICIAAGAIALHNLNKKIWREEEMADVCLNEFCLEMEGDEALPIAFLLRLTDEMQDWDREYYRALEPDDEPLKGRDMDIEIQKDKICLSYLLDNNNFIYPDKYPKGRFSGLKSNLSLYLNKEWVERLLTYGIENVEKTKKSEERWGLKKIYTARSEAHMDYKATGFAQNSCDIIAFGLRNFRNNVGKMVAESAKKGLKVRILTMQPDSLFVKQRELEEGVLPKSIKDSILELLRWVDDIKRALPDTLNKDESIQVKYYDSLPLDFYCKMDDKMYIGPYLAGKESHDMITYEFGFGEVWDLYAEYFENLWNDKVKGIKPINKAFVYQIRTQQEIVESILESYCNILTDFNDPKKRIRGIAVKYLQNNEKRKTIFFWNKAEGTQKYPEINRNYGVAGKMDEYRRPYIHCFRRGEAGSYYSFSSDGEVQKPEHKQEEGGRKDGMKAILAAPIWNYSREKIVGIVTFEFIKEAPLLFSKLDEEISAYLSGDGGLDEVVTIDVEGKDGIVNKFDLPEWPELKKLDYLLNISKECATVLSQIIVNYMEVDQERLFENDIYGK